MKYGLIRTIVTAFCAIFLCHCGGQPTRDAPEQREYIQANSIEHAQKLINQSLSAQGPQRHALILSAAEILLDNGESEWAAQLAEQIKPELLPSDLFARWALLRTDLAIAENDNRKAAYYLSALRDEARLAKLSPQTKLRYRSTKAKLLLEAGDYSASLQELISLSDLLGEEIERSSDDIERETLALKQLDNEQTIWKLLMEMPTAELEAFSLSSEHPDALGWYTLALLTRDNQSNLEQQLLAVNNWTLEWPDHPASLRPPADLQLLAEIADNQPQQIAVLLPFSGALQKAANSIRDGLIAAYYGRASTQQQVPAIRFYDSSTEDINALYDRAVDDGAELIIGPLQKKAITELSLRLYLDVPTLALNTIDSSLQSSEGLFQFGLAVEDEIRQITEQAWRDGHRRVLILAPEDAWGDRNLSSFIPAWQALGGEIAHYYRYSGKNDYSNVIKRAMHIDRSEERAKSLSTIVGRFESTPRRRKDIDMIFIAADVKQARQIKPTLAFYFAEDIPVYATHRVFSGISAPKLDQDMNGIQFTTMPWYFMERSPVKSALKPYAEKSAYYQQLYALGADAFNIYPRLRQLNTIKQAQFYGFTGRLKIDESQRVSRDQTWARFSSGRAKAISGSVF